MAHKLMTRVCGGLLGAAIALGLSSGVWADGSETLGPPGIAIGGGTGIVAAGTGLLIQPGVININVPGTPVQALAYWECNDAPNTTGDNTIFIGGLPVLGTLIGPPHPGDAGTDAQNVVHRADITGMIVPGPNALSVEMLDCLVPDGAGILVIFDDGASPLAEIDIRDGRDLAFLPATPPRDATVPQTFTFGASNEARTATLAMFFGSVTGPASGGGAQRPHDIQVTVDGPTIVAQTTSFIDPLGSNDGDEWDTFVPSINIPAGANTLTVQAFSRDLNGSGLFPSSLVWATAGLSVPVGPAIQLVKQVSLTGSDPFFDADNPGDPDVPVGLLGADATYRLIVTNIGSETLTDLRITDPTLLLFDVPVPGGNLLPGESRTIVDGDIGFILLVQNRCDSLGNQNNIAKVDAQGVTSGTPVTDDDPANVNCIQGPAITLLKQVSLTGGEPFFDADSPGDPDVPLGSLGADATYRLIVRNVGDEALINAVINDPTLGLVNVLVPGLPLFPGEERVIDAGGAFANLFVMNRCDDAGNKANIALVDAVGQDTGVPVSDQNPANVNCRGECTIAVSKSCLVVAPPPDNLLCEDKIAATTLRYIGPDQNNATVVFEGTNGGLATYTNVNLVSGVTILTQAGQNGFTIDAQPGDLGSKTSITIDGVEEIIHTSCSAIYAAGQPAPLDGGTPNPPNSSKGDPSPNWFVVNFVDKEGAFVEVPGPQAGGAVCEVFAANGTECKKRPSQVSLRYNGGDCSQSMNAQPSDKFSCTDVFPAGEPVRIVVSKPDGNNVSLDTVVADTSIGDIVVADAANFGKDTLESDSLVRIFNGVGTLLQEVKFHTSCSRPLRIGDKFGSIEVVGFVNSEQGIVQTGANVEYAYKVTNTGTSDVSLTSVLDDLLGELLNPSPQALGAGEMLSLSATEFIDTDTTNIVTVLGNVAGNPAAVCEATATTTVNVVVPPTPPGSCADGKPVALEFEYTGGACDPTLDNLQEGKFSCLGNPVGAAPVQIVITKDADKVGATPNTESINVGGLFTVARTNGDRLASETKFDIRQGGVTLQSLNIHTSCSKELNAGDRFGGVTLRTFVPEN